MTSHIISRVVVIGAGGHGSEVVGYIQASKYLGRQIDLLGVLDDKMKPSHWKSSTILGTLEFLTTLSKQHERNTLYYMTAVGENRTRSDIVRRIQALGLRNVVSWDAFQYQNYVGPDCPIGEGTLLAPQSLVTAHSSVGKHCILNIKASVSHDSVIEDFVNLNPDATICGNVTIGEGSYIGAGATVINNVHIGKWCVIGAGAVVTDSLPDSVTAVGVPARIIKRNEGK